MVTQASVSQPYAHVRREISYPSPRKFRLRHTAASQFQMSGVASDASFPGKRDCGAIRESGSGRPGPAAGCQGVNSRSQRCKIVCVARPGQQVVAGDRLADRIGIGVLAKVFPPELVDRVVEQAGVREQRTRTLPARVVVYYLLAMVLFFQSVTARCGTSWSRAWTGRGGSGAPGSGDAAEPGGDHLRAPAAGCGDGTAAGGDRRAAGPPGRAIGVRSRMRLVAIDGMCLDLPDNEENGRSSATRVMTRPRPVPADPRGGLGECGTRRCSARRPRRWPPGSSRWPAGCRQAPARGLAAGRPEFPVPWPAQRRSRSWVHVLCERKATWISRCWRCCPTGRGCRGSLPGRLRAGCAARRLRRGHSRHHRPRHRVLGDFRDAARPPRPSPGHDLLDPALLSPEQAAGAYASRCSWKPASVSWKPPCAALRRGAAVEVPADDPAGDLRHALLLPGHPHPDQPRRPRRRDGPRQDLLHPRPRRDPGASATPAMLFPLIASTTSPPTWPSRSPSPAISSPAAWPPLRAQDQAPRRPVQDPQTRRDRPATPLPGSSSADAHPRLT